MTRDITFSCAPLILFICPPGSLPIQYMVHTCITLNNCLLQVFFISFYCSSYLSNTFFTLVKLKIANSSGSCYMAYFFDSYLSFSASFYCRWSCIMLVSCIIITVTYCSCSVRVFVLRLIASFFSSCSCNKAHHGPLLLLYINFQSPYIRLYLLFSMA